MPARIGIGPFAAVHKTPIGIGRTADITPAQFFPLLPNERRGTASMELRILAPAFSPSCAMALSTIVPSHEPLPRPCLPNREASCRRPAPGRHRHRTDSSSADCVGGKCWGGRRESNPRMRLVKLHTRRQSAAAVMSAPVQVFGRRRGRANHTARRPASEKRQGTKSRKWGTRPCREPLWGFGDEPSHEEPRLRSLACSAYIEPCVFACWRKSGKQIGHEVGGIVGEQAEHPP